MSRVKRAKNGQFAGSYAGADAPTSGVRSLLDRILRRPAPATAPGPYSPPPAFDDPFADLDRAYHGFSAPPPPPPVAASAPRTPAAPVDYTDDTRFGMGNKGHAQIDAAQHDFSQIVAAPIDYTYADGQHVHLDFDTDKARDCLRTIAYKVLLENGEIDDYGRGEYHARRDVYSPETTAAARRIYNDLDVTGFRKQTYSGEDTQMFPTTKTVEGNNVTYTHSLHPTGSALLSGVRRDQERHSGLQADIAERAEQIAARRTYTYADPFADI